MAWPAWLAAARLTAVAAADASSLAAGRWPPGTSSSTRRWSREGYWRWRDPTPALPGRARHPDRQLPGLAALRAGADGGAAAPPAGLATRPPTTGRCRAVPLDVRSVGARARGVPRAARLGGLGRRSAWALVARAAGGDAVGARVTAGALARDSRALAVALHRCTRVGQRRACCAGPADPAPPASAVARAAAAARRGRPGRAVPARRCSPSGACPGCGSWSSTTAPPTAPPTWSARSAGGDPGPAADRRGRCRRAGSASRTPASSSPTPAADADVLVFVDADVVLAPDAVAARGRPCCGGPASTCSRRTRGSARRPGDGWSSRCCSGRG